MNFSFQTPAQEAQKIRFDRISSENFKIEKGLSQNSVNCILQDSYGYMWFGTWDGLNKYDGYSFFVFKPNYIAQEDDMSNQTVNALYEDKNGYIWIGTETGLNRYDRRTQKFLSYHKQPSNPSCISSDTVYCILESSDGTMWIGTNDGLNKFDRRNEQFFHYHLNPNDANSPSNNTIRCLFEDKQGNIWFGTDNGLNIYNVKNRIFSHFYHSSENSNTISSDIIRDLMLDRKGNLWICTDGGLDRYDFNTKKLIHYKNDESDPYSMSNDHVTSVLEDRLGYIWVGTYGGGLNLFNPFTNSFFRYSNNTYDPNSLSNDYINTIYQDKSGIIWVATAWKGVNKIDRYANKFIHYQRTSDEKSSLSSNIIWSIYLDKKGLIWLATDAGINILDRKDNSINFLTTHDGLPSNLSRVVFEDSKNYMWFGTYDAGIARYDLQTKQFMYFKHAANDPRTISSDRIWGIVEYPPGSVWVASDGGLDRINTETFEIRHFRHDPKNPNSICGDDATCLYLDDEKRLWIGTHDGLSYYDFNKSHFYSYSRRTDNKYSLSTNVIFSIIRAKDGIYWIGTMGGGLNRFDIKTGLFTYYTEQDGLANNIIYNLFEDKSGRLWMSTNYGVSAFDIKARTFINYDVKDGLQGNEYNLGAAWQDMETDEIFFGGMNGFNSFFPNMIKTNNYIPAVVISSFRIFDNIQRREISDGDTLLLNYSDNFFSFEFSALDYSNPSKNKYAFKLENYDKEWNYRDAYQRYANYTNVSPGTYIFRVKGSNSDAIWNEKGISVVIIMRPPWWKTWYFRTGVLLAIFLLAWYIIFLRLRTIRRKHADEKKILEIERQMFELEQTALRLQMNPHFIFNSLNSIQSFVINSDTDRAINYLAKFSQLMRLNLSNSQQSFVPIQDDIKALSHYLDIEQLRFDNKFKYSISIDPMIDQEFMEIPPMVIQPYVENAIIHGILHKEGTGIVKISLSQKGEFIHCTIEDDGIGREKAAILKAKSDLGHKSRGMLITQKRLEILNKRNPDHVSIIITDLKDDVGIAIGTRVEIFILFQE